MGSRLSRTLDEFFDHNGEMQNIERMLERDPKWSPIRAGRNDLIPTWLVLNSAIRWAEHGRVEITCSGMLQSLLAVTPTGQLEKDDWQSPYGSHAVLLDPPMRFDGKDKYIFAVLIAQENSGLPYGAGIGSANNVPFVFSGPKDLDALVRPGGDVVFGSGKENISAKVAMQRALRVAIGLSRLIKSAPPAGRGGKSATDQVVIEDRGTSKKSGTRSVYVRDVFAVEPRVIDACRAALRGGPRAPCLRHLVRGHWRNQAVGKERKERSLRWIQPFWKGVMKGVVPSRVEVRVH